MKHAIISAYDLPDGSRIERVQQRTGLDRWAVRDCGNCLGKDGEWEYENLPSNRTDEFRERCRFDTPEEAYSIWERYESDEKPR